MFPCPITETSWGTRPWHRVLHRKTFWDGHHHLHGFRAPITRRVRGPLESSGDRTVGSVKMGRHDYVSADNVVRVHPSSSLEQPGLVASHFPCRVCVTFAIIHGITLTKHRLFYLLRGPPPIVRVPADLALRHSCTFAHCVSRRGPQRHRPSPRVLVRRGRVYSPISARHSGVRLNFAHGSAPAVRTRRDAAQHCCGGGPGYLCGRAPPARGAWHTCWAPWQCEGVAWMVRAQRGRRWTQP